MRQLLANHRWALVTALLVLSVIVVFLALPENEKPLYIMPVGRTA